VQAKSSTRVVVGLALVPWMLWMGQAAADLIGPGVPSPADVDAKEYSDNPDMGYDADGNWVALPEQVLGWDDPEDVWNVVNYGGSGEVDAISDAQDAYFDDVINNKCALLFSEASDAFIWYHDTGGGSDVWASPSQINSDGVTDVDGLEIWPGDGGGEANRYSLSGDPAAATGGARVSVWAYQAETSSSVPYIYAADLADAIDESNPDLANALDLDAMMTYDVGDDHDEPTFGTGDSIMFSIAPIDVFDGSEVWVWHSGQSATLLERGGHTFVTGEEGYGADINALEAAWGIPEPTTLVLFGTGILGIALRLRRRKRR